MLPERSSGKECANEEVAEALKREVLNNFMDRIRTETLLHLLGKFKEFQSLFCFGTREVDTIIMKERLRWVVGEVVLDVLETSYPEIMSYGQRTGSKSFQNYT